MLTGVCSGKSVTVAVEDTDFRLHAGRVLDHLAQRFGLQALVLIDPQQCQAAQVRSHEVPQFFTRTGVNKNSGKSRTMASSTCTVASFRAGRVAARRCSWVRLCVTAMFPSVSTPPPVARCVPMRKSALEHRLEEVAVIVPHR